MTFLYPVFLALLLLAPVVWVYPKRADNVVHAVFRTCFMAFLIVALARPVMLSSDTDTYRVFVVDQSESLSPDQKKLAIEAFKELRSQVSHQFAQQENVSFIQLGGAVSEDEALSADIQIVEERASSLGAVLEIAAQQVPTGMPGLITLITDGLSTEHDWGPAVQSLTSRNVHVNTFDLGLPGDDFYISGFNLDKPILKAGQTALGIINVVGTGEGFRVRLDGPDGQLAISEQFSSDGQAQVVVPFDVPETEFFKVTATLVSSENSAKDRVDSNNSMTRLFAIQPPLRVLYLGDRQINAASRLNDMIGAGFDVIDGSGMPIDGETDLESYDLVFLDDRPASKMPASIQDKLVNAVHERGLGLLYSGGRAAYGEGGYEQSPVSTTLPVSFSAGNEKKDPSVAIAVVIDTSGSMAGFRMDLAKQIARLAIRRLQSHDRVGVVEFYGAKQWALPMQPATNKIEIERTIGRMQAIGGTILYPAIEEAYYGVKNANTQYKHILVITDAGVEDADYESLLREVASERVSVSTVLVGDSTHNDIMFNLASWGNGRFYPVGDRFSLVEMVLKQTSETELPMYRSGTFPVEGLGGSGWWGDLEDADLPDLSGYVETSIRSGSEVLLALKGQSKPILSTWRYGLGRVTAMSTEPFGSGTSAWREWSGYGVLMARLINRTASDYIPFTYSVERKSQGFYVVARRMGSNENLRPTATRLDSDLELEFKERAPGHFEALLAPALAEDIPIRAGVAGKAGRQTHLVASLSAWRAPETQLSPADKLDLEALAAKTGGSVLTDDTSAAVEFSVEGDNSSVSIVGLWPYILSLALLFYFGDILYRRGISEVFKRAKNT
ncbi:VWA domain-containing protein [Porticoccus sp. W117]|uniref:VWA domain-containing protein n=1 Tax=Porticoccus sp. W117 TaxID=3054777 RepID=UPI00259AA50F|nr:VWA domain-containing protein [Porticoccus sp. W117]MDM3872154.1 VWA domain-containing protein [Porticoccus sp. W117]